MSYSLNISEYLNIYNGEQFENLTINECKPTLETASDYGYESIEEFEESDSFYEWQDKKHPIYNFAHVLQYEPTSEQVQLIHKNAPNMSIIYVHEIETYLIALNACGMDLSDSIAYAYMIIDNKVPKSMIPQQRMTLSKENYAELQSFLEDK